MLEWRYGARSFHLRAGQECAVEYADADRERVLRRFDLRQALIDWPHGLEWREESPGRLRAEASSGSEADLPFAAGSFVAELDGDANFKLAQGAICAAPELDVAVDVIATASADVAASASAFAEISGVITGG